MFSQQTELNISHEFFSMRQEVQETQLKQQSPHVLMRPKIFPDGNQWCALYGDNLQDGVAGFGLTPDCACVDFDRNWYSQKLMVK